MVYLKESILLFSTDKYTVYSEYNGSNKPLYIGESEPGAMSSESKWRIRMFVYDISDNPIELIWASGNTNFDKVWDDRATYIYS